MTILGHNFISFDLKKIGAGTLRVVQHLVGEGSVSFTDGRKKVPERHSGLRPSEKELPKRRFVTEIPLSITYSCEKGALNNVRIRLSEPHNIF
jgi:hypothetical protein